MDAGGEETALLAGADRGEREHRYHGPAGALRLGLADGLVAARLPCRLGDGLLPRHVAGRIEQELVDGEVPQRQRQGDDHQPVQPLAHRLDLRRGAVDLAVAQQPLGGQLEGPGGEHGGDEADTEHDDHAANRSVAEAEGREDGLHDLDDQPRHRDIGRGDAQDVAAFEF